MRNKYLEVLFAIAILSMLGQVPADPIEAFCKMQPYATAVA